MIFSCDSLNSPSVGSRGLIAIFPHIAAGLSQARVNGLSNQTATTKTIEQRFWEKIDKSPNEKGCWNWTGSCSPKGYGEFWRDGKLIRAHRFSFILHKGLLPDGKIVLHDCDNPSCVNPNHLKAGTNQDNTDDMMERNGHWSQNKPELVARGERNGANTHPELLPRGSTHGMSKLNEEKVIKIRALANEGVPCWKIADDLNLHENTIRCVVKRRTWKHI